MLDKKLEIDENDPLLESEVALELVRQMHALDSYGTYDGWSAAKLLDPFVLTKERRREIPVVGDPDEITMARLGAYYNAIAVLIEKRCGQMAVPMKNMSHEGFGRVIISVGKLIVLDRSLRDVHRFGFDSLEKLVAEAQKLIDKAVATTERFPDVVND